MQCCEFCIIILFSTLTFAKNDDYILHQGSIRSDSKIVSGEVIDITNVPCQVSVKHDQSHKCGGSILNKRFILTAAHCLKLFQVKRTTVSAGSNNPYENETSFNAKAFYLHPLYETVDYDFGIIELSEDILFNERQKSASLPQADEDIPDGTLLQASGWGQTNNISESPYILRGVKLPKIDQVTCRLAYSKHTTSITDRMLCAGYFEGGLDSCYGDSGGPLLSGNTIVGVTSWGISCGCPGYPGVYAKVSAVRQWIRDITGS
ncbi:trypsin [Sergentomyia squamirostris]